MLLRRWWEAVEGRRWDGAGRRSRDRSLVFGLKGLGSRSVVGGLVAVAVGAGGGDAARSLRAGQRKAVFAVDVAVAEVVA